jgi:D-beta-D-heptose 7-phosphate kinase/D-beta-D-heptose 1-phosphate adenosyltransferase
MIELDKFNQKDILIVGDVMLDEYVWGDMTRISPEGPFPIIREDYRSYGLGGAANVARCVAALGSRSILLGVTGSEDLGHLNKTISLVWNITSKLYSEFNRHVTKKTRIYSGDRQIYRIDRESTRDIGERAKGWLKSQIEEYDSVGAIIVSDYAKGTVTYDIARYCISEGLMRKIPVIVDPKDIFWEKYRDATVVTPNLKELSQYVGHYESFNVICQNVRETLNLGSLVVTKSENGMSLFQEGTSEHIESIKTDVVDVSGAGDSVVATLGVCLAAGMSIESSVKLANWVGSRTVSRIEPYPQLIAGELVYQLDRVQSE